MAEIATIKLDVSQMEQLESMVARLENAAKGKKTIRTRLWDLLFGRMMLISAFTAYMFLQNGMPDFSTVQKEVLKFDATSGILTISNRGELENFIMQDDKVTKNGKEVFDDYLDQVKYAILLETDYPTQRGWW